MVQLHRSPSHSAPLFSSFLLCYPLPPGVHSLKSSPRHPFIIVEEGNREISRHNPCGGNNDKIVAYDDIAYGYPLPRCPFHTILFSSTFLHNHPLLTSMHSLKWSPIPPSIIVEEGNTWTPRHNSRGGKKVKRFSSVDKLTAAINRSMVDAWTVFDKGRLLDFLVFLVYYSSLLVFRGVGLFY